MAPLGGSRAQREVVEDTLVHALAMAGRTTEAADAARPAPLPSLLRARRATSGRGVRVERVGQQLMALDGFSSVAVTTMITLAIVDLHVELVAGAAAWTAGWWLLREPGGNPR